MYVERYAIALASDASGNATAYSSRPVTGEIRQLRYVPDVSTPLDTGADLTITGETTGVAISTLTDIGTSAFTKNPRAPTHGLTGTASLYASGGLGVETPVVLAGERIKVVLAQGGNTKAGTLYVWVA